MSNWKPTKEQIDQAMAISDMHEKGFPHMKRFHVYADMKLQKMAIISSKSEVSNERLKDGTPRYDFFV